MQNPLRPQGIFCPVVTPFDGRLDIDLPRFEVHCRHLLGEGVGLAVFGTNSEASSIAPRERMAALEHLVAAGLPADRMMPGTGCCSVEETVELTRHALSCGVRNVLVLPPYFYARPSEEGLVSYYSEVIERIGNPALAMYLYNIPAFTQVPISIGLVEGLLRRYPTGTIAGLKDSSGDWNCTQGFLDAFADTGFDVFCASELFLTATLDRGGAGCISATANVNPAGLARIQRLHGKLGAREAQADADRIRQVFQAWPMISAMKAFLAESSGTPDWRRVRPPLTELSVAETHALMDDLEGLGLQAVGATP